MRIRTIKPEFWGHPVMGRQAESTQLMAIGLLNLADDGGYFYADPKLVRNALRPFDDDSGSTTVALRELSKIGFIEVRNHPTHGPIGFVVNFDRNQVINKPRRSKFLELWGFCEPSEPLPEDYGSTTVVLPSGKEWKGMEEEQGKEPIAPSGTSSVSKRRAERITWSLDNGFDGITDKDMDEWRAAFPAVNIPLQIAAAHVWVKDNPTKRKTYYGRFLSNWFSRKQERGGDMFHSLSTSPQKKRGLTSADVGI